MKSHIRGTLVMHLVLAVLNWIYHVLLISDISKYIDIGISLEELQMTVKVLITRFLFRFKTLIFNNLCCVSVLYTLRCWLLLLKKKSLFCFSNIRSPVTTEEFLLYFTCQYIYSSGNYIPSKHIEMMKCINISSKY